MPGKNSSSMRMSPRGRVDPPAASPPLVPSPAAGGATPCGRRRRPARPRACAPFPGGCGSRRRVG
eukprot:3176093-Pleurochrysis_carterae.AAC.1